VAAGVWDNLTGRGDTNSNNHMPCECHSRPNMANCCSAHPALQIDAPDYYNTLRKSCESKQPKSMVCCQRPAHGGQLRLNSNSYMLFECHLSLPNCKCTQVTAQQDARD
jgi:hypothetical protein